MDVISYPLHKYITPSLKMEATPYFRNPLNSLFPLKECNSKGFLSLDDLAKTKHADKTKWIIKAKKVPLMMIILPSEVDGDG